MFIMSREGLKTQPGQMFSCIVGAICLDQKVMLYPINPTSGGLLRFMHAAGGGIKCPDQYVDLSDVYVHGPSAYSAT